MSAQEERKQSGSISGSSPDQQQRQQRTIDAHHSYHQSANARTLPKQRNTSQPAANGGVNQQPSSTRFSSGSKTLQGH